MANSDTLVFLDGTVSPVDGRTLSSFATTLYVVEIGNIGDGSAQAVAAAANQAYRVADLNGIAITAVRGGVGGITAGEHLIFTGLTDGGQAEYWFWGSLAQAAGGFVPAASLSHSADANGNHLVDAAELTQLPNLLAAVPTGSGELG